MLEVIAESGPFQLFRDHHGHVFLYQSGHLVPATSSRDAREQFNCLSECLKDGEIPVEQPEEAATW